MKKHDKRTGKSQNQRQPKPTNSNVSASIGEEPQSSPTQQRESQPSRSLVGYVHKLSPLKRNRRDTMNYSTFVFQGDNENIREGLCFSSAKRRLLQEKESNRIAVKLTGYTFTGADSKIVVNDVTTISTANPAEYSFQYSSEIDTKYDQVISLKQVISDACSDMDLVNVSVKVVAIEPLQIVGKDKWKLVNALVSDTTQTIMLELWQDHTQAVQISKTYVMRNVRIRLRSGVKKLGTTKDTVIEETLNSELKKVHYETENGKAESMTPTKTITVCRIECVKKVETFRKCANCSSKIIQVSASPITFCDKCEATMRSADCSDGFWAKIVVKVNGEDVSLTIFEEILEPFLEGNAPSIDVLSQRLLLNTNDFVITYNPDTNIVSAMCCQ